MPQQYSTLVGAARAKKRAPNKAATAVAGAENTYGAALGDVAANAYSGLRARVGAGIAEAAANRARMQAMQGAAATSAATYGTEQAAMQTGYTQQQALVQQNAKPGLISAKSAIAQANSYADRLGINLKDMNVQARSAVYQAIIQQNSEMLRMQFQQHLDQENMQYQYDLQQKAATDAELKGAPPVVNAVNAAIPGILNELQDADADKLANPAEWATSIAQKYAVDPAAQGLLAGVALQLAQGYQAHTADGVLDGNWVRSVVTSSVTDAYPDYNDPTVHAALSNGVLSSVLSVDPGGWGPESIWGDNGFVTNALRYAPVLFGGSVTPK